MVHLELAVMALTHCCEDLYDYDYMTSKTLASGSGGQDLLTPICSMTTFKAV